MEKFEYFSGIPEVGIVPRAPHAGPLLRHVSEQEHGRAWGRSADGGAQKPPRLERQLVVLRHYGTPNLRGGVSRRSLIAFGAAAKGPRARLRPEA